MTKIKQKNKKSSRTRTRTRTRTRSKSKYNKEYDLIKKEIGNSLVRKIGNIITPVLKRLFGYYYFYIHLFIMFTSANILLFSNNIFHLFVVMSIVFMDCVACIFLHDCPLTILEHKYLNDCIVDTKPFILRNMNIMYKCNHRYESTLDFLTNMLTLFFGKINVLILMKLLNINMNTNILWYS